jgi:hypothetical protein
VTDDPVLVLDDDVSPCVVVQNDLIRYLFSDEDDDGDQPDAAHPETP